MTKKTIEGVSIELQYIKELLEKEFDLNRKTHDKMIEKQNITNGSIIRHEDRIGTIETNCKIVQTNKKWYLAWIPSVIVAIASIASVVAIVHFSG